jgi:CRP/FNR family cyclic AMP-dependent transcriptional regulator
VVDVDVVQSRLIRRVPLFAMLTERRRSRRRRGGQAPLQARRVVVEQGKKSNTLFIMLTGRARVLTSDSAAAR